MLKDIEFTNYKKNSDIHGTVLYPAVMVAPMQNLILEEMINNKNCTSIFDPFHGSGTTLYESKIISNDIKIYGCDINPLANLITRVKLDGINKNLIHKDIDQLKYNFYNLPFNIHHFNNIDKWFEEDIKIILSQIRNSIIHIKNNQNRLFFWYMFCDIIRLFSNTRSSTYKLHLKTDHQIEKLNSDTIFDTYILNLENNLHFFSNNFDNYNLFKVDILDFISSIDTNFFDLSITSPPYGDNKTTVPYGQFSSLPIFWIDSNDLNIEGWELKNYSIIDSQSLGGQIKKHDIEAFSSYEKKLILPYINNIQEHKQQKVINFFVDYFYFLSELIRVTSKYIVMTLGNRTVDGINIDLTSITFKYLENYGFKNIEFGKRKIVNKRMPKFISSVNNKPVKSMNHEYIIIHENTNII